MKTIKVKISLFELITEKNPTEYTLSKLKKEGIPFNDEGTLQKGYLHVYKDYEYDHMLYVWESRNVFYSVYSRIRMFLSTHFKKG